MSLAVWSESALKTKIGHHFASRVVFGGCISEERQPQMRLKSSKYHFGINHHTQPYTI